MLELRGWPFSSGRRKSGRRRTRWLPASWKAQIQGVGIQATALLAASAYAFVAPRVLGPETYGAAALALSGPYFLQLALEAVIIPSVTRWAESVEPENTVRLSRLQRDMLIVGGLGLAGASAFSFGAAIYAHVKAPLALAGLCCLYLALVVANAYLIGYAYARKAHTVLMTCYALAAVTFGAVLVVVSGWGPHGMVVALCVTNLAVAAVLLKRIGVCRFCLVKQSPQIRGNAWRDTYLPLLAPRAAQLVLNQGTTILAGLQMSPSELAGYRVTLSLVAGTAYLIPVAPTVLLRTVQENVAHSSRSFDKQGLLVLMGAFLVALLLTAAFLHWGPEVRAMVLRSPGSRYAMFDAMFWAIPFYALIPALSAYVIGTNGEEALLLGFGACMAFLLVTTWVLGVVYGFVLGSIAFVAAAGWSHVNIAKSTFGRPPRAGT